MRNRSRDTWARRAAAALLLAAALALAGCGPKAGGAPAGTASPGAAASSAAAAASQFATSAAGQEAKKEAAALAAACKDKLGPQGYGAMAPLVPGARQARKDFIKCEEVPRPKVASWLACLAGVYTHAPAKGPQGSPAETRRQTAIEDGAGQCTATAKGIKLGTASPAASPSGTSS
jgi:hypothetical protein